MKIDQPGSHLDHMIRQTRSHHAELSSMADLKANMLLTVASVVFTLAATRIQVPELRWAIVTLLPFCLVTVALCAYATMPASYSGGRPGSRPQLGDPAFNILFFGHFYDLPYDEYESAMESVMNDPSRTYQLQVREVYTLGVFLAKKKYRALRMAYAIFIIGLTASGVVAILMAVSRSSMFA